MNNEIPNAMIDGVPNTKIHIQNIPPHLSDVHLKQVLSQAGNIKDVCYFNKNKKQMNNYQNKKIYNTALITFNTHEEALYALQNIKNLIDSSQEERAIEAKFAIPNVNNWGMNNNANPAGNNYNSFTMPYRNNYNEVGNQNMNNMGNYNFMNRNKNRPMNGMMNPPINPPMNNMMMNANGNDGNNSMITSNNLMYHNFQKNMSDVSRENEMGIGSNNTGRTNNQSISNSNNNMSMYQTSEQAFEENENNLDGLSLWESYKDNNNNVYYYNNLTKHTQWKKPIHPNKLFQYNSSAEKPKQNGPSGSNLFIFHIPSEWSDADLFQHFCCFGNVISSKIKRDETGRNSGFGFVSYDNIISAHYAIQFMNGYFVNNKYLKVQLKKGEVALKENLVQM